MKHALRKYISPCGSALFMVVSTMAALIVLVTAMYMSVLSSRQVQYATFDQEQAYVSSTSIADIICSYIADNKNGGDSFVQQVLKLENPGDSISTNGNGFASLNGGSNDDTILGGYDVGVTKMKDETISGTTWHVYDVAVTVANNGVLETTHTYLRTKDPEPEDMPPIDRFFTATGYIPNDVWIDSGIYKSTLYIDSEYVQFGKVVGGNTALVIKSGLICAGTAVFNHENAEVVQTPEPTLWAIGNNMIIKSQPNTYDLGGTAAEHGILIVGGDLDIQAIANFGSGTGYTDVYVLGNLKINAQANFHGNLYVNGNIYINVTSGSKTKIDGKLYQSAGGILDVTMNPDDGSGLQTLIEYTGKGCQTIEQLKSTPWIESETSPKEMMTQEDATSKLNEAIGASVYPKWIANIDVAKKNVKNIIFNANWGETDLSTIEVQDPKNPAKTVSLSSYYGLSKAEEKMIPKFVEVIDSDCTIGDIVNAGPWHNGGNNLTIIFDTGSAGNTLTINLEANTDLNPDDSDDTLNGFTWAAADADNGVVDLHSSDKLRRQDRMNILTVGDGNLVINVPEYTVIDDETGEKETKSVIYQATPQEFFGHYGWYMFSGGSVQTLEFNKTSYQKYGSCTTSANMPDKVREMIHSADGCTDCADPAKPEDNKYVECKNSNGDKGYTCSIHGGFVEAETKPTTCQCTGRIEKDEFPEYYYEGELQRPNVNIFLVSCSESADIQIGCLKYPLGGKVGVNENVYYGYVYAPYMTYMDKSDGKGGGLKSTGGIIVSDYIMAGYYEYVYAKPDQSIEEIVGKDFDPVTPNANRSWRIHGV